NGSATSRALARPHPEERACASASAKSNERARVSKDEDGHGGGYGSRLSLAVARIGRDDSGFSLENQPPAVGDDRELRSIVSGLLFTMDAATPTCRAVSARLHRPALAQHVERDPMALDRRRNPAIERDQQQNVANLFRRAAIGERAVDVDAKLVRAPDRRRHRDRGERFRLERQRGTAPDITIGISVDHVLQRLAERAERVHALLDRVATEHLPAKLQSLVMQVARIHHSLSLTIPPAFRHSAQARLPAEPRPIPWR